MSKETIFGFVRHVLTFGGGFLVAKDLVPAEQLDTAVAALITLAGVIWSAVEKRKA